MHVPCARCRSDKGLVVYGNLAPDHGEHEGCLEATVSPNKRFVVFGAVIMALGFAMLALIAHHPGHGLVPPRIKRMEMWAVATLGGLLVVVGIIRSWLEPSERPVDAGEFVHGAVEQAEALRDGTPDGRAR
jgi:hypothetical protein